LKPVLASCLLLGSPWLHLECSGRHLQGVLQLRKVGSTALTSTTEGPQQNGILRRPLGQATSACWVPSHLGMWTSKRTWARSWEKACDSLCFSTQQAQRCFLKQ
jgi:hypothetical protein